jgi:hypothetical protein
MLRGFFVIFLLCTIAIVAVFGFRGQKGTQPPTEVFPDMVRQMKVRAQAPLDFFADGRGPRLPVTGTVPIGYEMPKLGMTMCHGPTAEGNGITKQYGLATVVSLQDERIRKMSDGEIFNTITNGKNTMMAYGPNIIVPDRWAIIAYLRALQRSQHAATADVPQDHRAELEKK